MTRESSRRTWKPKVGDPWLRKSLRNPDFPARPGTAMMAHGSFGGPGVVTGLERENSISGHRLEPGDRRCGHATGSGMGTVETGRTDRQVRQSGPERGRRGPGRTGTTGVTRRVAWRSKAPSDGTTRPDETGWSATGPGVPVPIEDRTVAGSDVWIKLPSPVAMDGWMEGWMEPVILGAECGCVTGKAARNGKTCLDRVT
ncbi:hypothetical protein AXG93_3943s1280 [Marchantia polymorpha subsp. ruderalis]|uniref:Uncharacterized protein n=1 Tax=Marchantia polymorpha subsp. ruderalis TaxID=1480154 RepID=A0A176WCQ4_MARPO|nr:hypothetical protein AXG93_3943s1280 [Marchantia polymorpha subsp. ruderalis]